MVLHESSNVYEQPINLYFPRKRKGSILKKALTAGLVILLAGLFLTYAFGAARQERTETQMIASLDKSWTISAYFEKGENLTLRFSPHPDWSYRFYLEPEEDQPLYRKYLWINITDNSTNTLTQFKVTLMPPLEYQPPISPYGFLLGVASIEKTQNGTLVAEEAPKAIGGRVDISGEYMVKCTLEPERVIGEDQIPKPASPPTLTLNVIRIKVTYPYSSLLPLGISTVAVGAVATAWGAKSLKRKARRKIVQDTRKA